MRTQFKDTVLDLARTDPSIVLLFGDISVFLFREFSSNYPERFLNAGICENTLISMAAGLSSQGFNPFVHTIAPFVTERSLEQIKLNMCYNGFGGNIVTCGASFDYSWDGATHHCYTDLAILRLLPNMEVMQPGNKGELDALIRSQYANGKPSYFRLAADNHEEKLETRFGKGHILQNKSARTTVVTAGPILKNVLEACRDLDVNLLYLHTLKPIDTELLQRFANTDFIVVHDAFGLFEAVSQAVGQKTRYIGLPDRFIDCYGTLEDVRQTLGLSVRGIRAQIERITHA